MLKYNFNSNCQKQPKVWISDDLKSFIFKVVFIAYTLCYKNASYFLHFKIYCRVNHLQTLKFWFSRPTSFKNISFYLSGCKIIVFVRDHQIYCEPLKWIIWNYFAHCLGKWGFNSPQNDILKANKQLHNVPHCEPHSKDECLTTYSIFILHRAKAPFKS